MPVLRDLKVMREELDRNFNGLNGFSTDKSKNKLSLLKICVHPLNQCYPCSSPNVLKRRKDEDKK